LVQTKFKASFFFISIKKILKFNELSMNSQSLK
jgi:hypothetical protein